MFRNKSFVFGAVDGVFVNFNGVVIDVVIDAVIDIVAGVIGVVVGLVLFPNKLLPSKLGLVSLVLSKGIGLLFLGFAY